MSVVGFKITYDGRVTPFDRKVVMDDIVLTHQDADGSLDGKTPDEIGRYISDFDRRVMFQQPRKRGIIWRIRKFLHV